MCWGLLHWKQRIFREEDATWEVMGGYGGRRGRIGAAGFRMGDGGDDVPRFILTGRKSFL